MALRLSLAFDTSAESWLAQQLQFDLWQAEKRCPAPRVKRLSVVRREGAHLAEMPAFL